MAAPALWVVKHFYVIKVVLAFLIRIQPTLDLADGRCFADCFVKL
jgi:hypothetical protein